MKTLITGIGGFVGPYLKTCLEKEGHEIFGFERNRRENSKNIYYGDILNSEDIQKAITQTTPDFIVHLAGFSSAKKSFNEPELCRRINVEGTKNLIESCLKLKKKTRVLIISSAEIYGKPQKSLITEEHPLNPESPYGKSRLDQEKLVQTYMDRMEMVISRSFNHTGPGQQPLFVVSNFAMQVVEVEKGLRPPTIFVGNLESVRDFTDVRDIVNAYRKALEQGKPSETYNICSGKGYKMQEILDRLVELSGVKVKIVNDKDRMRSSDIPVLIGSYRKFEKITGWKPNIPFEKTLSDMLDWWRSHLMKS